MLRRAGRTLVLQCSRRFLYQGPSSKPFNAKGYRTGLFVSSAVVTGAILCFSTTSRNRTVHGDAQRLIKPSELLQAANAVEADGTLNVVVWGSNK